MNPVAQIPPKNQAAPHRIEFFRLPQPGKRDPHFGLSRGWYYKAASVGEIKMIAVRQRGALRGVRLVVYDSVADYIRRSAQVVTHLEKPALAQAQLPTSLPAS